MLERIGPPLFLLVVLWGFLSGTEHTTEPLVITPTAPVVTPTTTPKTPVPQVQTLPTRVVTPTKTPMPPLDVPQSTDNIRKMVDATVQFNSSLTRIVGGLFETVLYQADEPVQAAFGMGMLMVGGLALTGLRVMLAIGRILTRLGG